MGGADKLQGKAYTRFLSSNIRKWTPKSGARFIEEDPIIGGVNGLARCVMLTVCRNRQRLLQQAWDTWTTEVELEHDYTGDMRAILSYPLKDTEMRSELELEVMFKWVRQHARDVTGIAYNIYSCSSKKVICQCLQHLRLESFQPGDPILYQGALPKDEDGHLTILSGSVDVVKFPVDSISFIKLQQYAKRCLYESARKLLLDCTVLATLETNAGFGELSTLTGVKRAVTIRASILNKTLTDVLVIPKEPFVECLEHRRGTAESDDSSPSEAIELFRQTGLAARINPQELVAAAASMKKINLTAGEVLYRKGDKAERIFLVVSGDMALDTMDPAPYKPPGKTGKPLVEPFLSSNEEHVFHLSGGSILGDEGILGMDDRYVASAAVASDRAVVFEAVGFSRKFLHDRVKAMRYAALVYKELPRWTVPIPEAESNNLYGYLNSLRRVISVCRPTRGVSENWHVKEDELVLEHFSEVAPSIREIKKKKALERRNNSKKDGVVGDGDREKEAAVALKKKKEEMEKRKQAAASKAVDSQRREKLKKRRNKKKRGGAAAAMNGNEEDSEDHLYRDAAGNVLDNRESSFSRLSIPALNAAKSFNAASRKLQNESVQLHARNNLLQDQLLREAAADDMVEFTGSLSSNITAGANDNTNGNPQRAIARSPEAMMRRSARKNHVHALSNKFNEALALYHARQEKYVEEEEEEEEELLRVGEAANMVSMFKQAAAGAINEGEGNEGAETGELSREVEDFDVVTDSFIEGVHDQDMTSEERVQTVIDLLAMPRVEQYLKHMLRLSAAGSRKKTDVERVDMEATFAASSDEYDAPIATQVPTPTQGTTTSGEDSTAAQELLVFKHAVQEAKKTGDLAAVEQTRLLLGKDWEKSGMPTPEVVNATYWRPPSSSSTKREMETGGLVPLLSPTHSRPATREVKDLRPSSPWKQKEYRFLGTSSQDTDSGEEGMGETKGEVGGGEEEGRAFLQSLRYDENHYKTHAARMKLVPSSGYGQQHIEAAAQEALGMSLKEFKNMNMFYRLPPPTGVRRIVLPPAVERMRRADKDTSKEEKKRKYDDDPLHNLLRRTGHHRDLDEQFSSWSIDLDSPEGFLAELQKKDFSKRREFLARNGWNTRAMRVTDNSRPVKEVSKWLREDFQRLAAREENEGGVEVVKKPPSPRKARAIDRERRRREEEEQAMWASLELGAQSVNMVVTEDGEEENGEAEEKDDDFSTGERPLLRRQHSPTMHEALEEDRGVGSDKESNPPSRGEPVDGGGGLGDSGLHTTKSFMAQNSANSSMNDVLEPKGEGSGSRISMSVKKSKKKVEEAPSYHEAKLPSNALRAYQDAKATEYSSRKFLDGKKKNNTTSKFKLAPVPIERGSGAGDTSMESSLNLLRPIEMRAAKEKDKALIASLVPEHVSMVRALEKIKREQEKKERERGNRMFISGVVGADATGPEYPSAYRGHDDSSFASHMPSSERDIHSWQKYSVQEAIRSKRGPQMTLPVLSLKGGDPLLKPPKKSSLKYGGAMAAVEGYDQIEFKPVSGYLDVFTRSFKGSKIE